jgi:hypothetical protein
MQEIDLLAEVIEEVSNGKHSVHLDSDGSVTILSGSGGSMLDGENTLEVWNKYKNMCDVTRHKLKLTW